MALVKLKQFSPFGFRFPTAWDDEAWPTLQQSAEGFDMYETDNEVVVKASVPGIPSDQVNVTFEDGVLRISGSNAEKEEERSKRKVVYQEQRTSAFSYATTLPRAVDAEKISAEVEDGVVTVTAPLAASAKPKKISVKAKGK